MVVRLVGVIAWWVKGETIRAIDGGVPDLEKNIRRLQRRSITCRSQLKLARGQEHVEYRHQSLW